MSIYISATAIKDYLVCPKRLFYRTSFPELSEATPDMIAGTVVHEALEQFWDNELAAVAYVNKKIDEFNLDPHRAEKIQKSLINFFAIKFGFPLNKGDLIEHKFKIALEGGNFLVGKIDRITGNGLVLDWKTSTRTPSSIDKDPQFLTYYLAYKNMFNKAPASVFYVSLLERKLVGLNFHQNIYDQLFNQVVPTILSRMKKNDLPATGLFGGGCFGCNFKKICFKDMEIEA